MSLRSEKISIDWCALLCRLFKGKTISCLYESNANTAAYTSAMANSGKGGGGRISKEPYYVATALKDSANVWIAERMIINSGRHVFLMRG